MPAWKVCFIGLCACVCLALTTATVIFSAARDWGWAGGLFAATLVSGGLFALFLRHADGSLDMKVPGARL